MEDSEWRIGAKEKVFGTFWTGGWEGRDGASEELEGSLAGGGTAERACGAEKGLEGRYQDPRMIKHIPFWLGSRKLVDFLFI